MTAKKTISIVLRASGPSLQSFAAKLEARLSGTSSTRAAFPGGPGGDSMNLFLCEGTDHGAVTREAEALLALVETELLRRTEEVQVQVDVGLFVDVNEYAMGSFAASPSFLGLLSKLRIELKTSFYPCDYSN